MRLVFYERFKVRPPPKVYPLLQNYRTHQGIITVASELVEILYKLFPNSIDKLPKETSLINGKEPLFLEEMSADSLILSLFGSQEVGNAEMGADQVCRLLIYSRFLFEM
jgi:hypothetical protein